MKRAPNLLGVMFLYDHVKSGPKAQTAAGVWVPARPLGFFSLRNRIKLAWGVFVGRYDAVKWPNPCR